MLQLTEVIGVPSGARSGVACEGAKDAREQLGKKPKNLEKSRGTRENPAFSDKDEA